MRGHIKKVYQKERHRGCLEACLSTLLQEDVPVWPNRRTARLARFLSEMGMIGRWEAVPQRNSREWLLRACRSAPPACAPLMIVAGPPYPDSRLLHCVVYLDGEFWHDPWRPDLWGGYSGDVDRSRPGLTKALLLSPAHVAVGQNQD